MLLFRNQNVLCARKKKRSQCSIYYWYKICKWMRKGENDHIKKMVARVTVTAQMYMSSKNTGFGQQNKIKKNKIKHKVVSLLSSLYRHFCSSLGILSK